MKLPNFDYRKSKLLLKIRCLKIYVFVSNFPPPRETAYPSCVLDFFLNVIFPRKNIVILHTFPSKLFFSPKGCQRDPPPWKSPKKKKWGGIPKWDFSVWSINKIASPKNYKVKYFYPSCVSWPPPSKKKKKKYRGYWDFLYVKLPRNYKNITI